MKRFWSKVEKTDTCWFWTASKCPEGYGRFKIDGKNKRAHRIAYEMLVGDIPEGLVLDHLCRNRACVNPAHLEPVTDRVNILRGDSVAAQRARSTETHCLRGHDLSGDNLRIVNTGRGRTGRRCVACKKLTDSRRAA